MNLQTTGRAAGPFRADAAGAGSPRGRAYAWYVLGVLFLVHSLNAVDRSVISILVEPIRKEFGFTDGQIGLLSGLGFAIFYGLFGIPVARLADRTNRRNILAAGLTMWSGMTVLTGYATGFGTMLAARIGVGVGEATCYPTAYPLIGDYFAPAQRPRAFAFFQAGVFVGIIAGAVIAGKVAEANGWRAAFHVVGLPGLVLAAIVMLTVREPLRGGSEWVAPAVSPDDGTRAAIRELVANRSFILVMLAATALSTASAVAANWGSALLMRLYGVSQGDVGVIAGPVVGLGGVAGTLIGGILGSIVAKRSTAARSPLIVPLVATIFAPIGLIMFCFGPTLPVVLVGGGLGAFLIALHTGPVIAVGISLVEPGKRGLASSILILGQTVIGFGFGPTIVGFLSDFLAGPFGRDSLRYAMLLAPGCVVLGWVLLLAAFRSAPSLPSAEPPAP